MGLKENTSLWLFILFTHSLISLCVLFQNSPQNTNKQETMNNLMSTSLYKIHPFLRYPSICPFQYPCRRFRVQATSSNELDNDTTALKVSKKEEIQDLNPTGLNQVVENQETDENSTSLKGTTSTANAAVGKDLKKVVQKTAATFAPRASVASKNPAVPGTALYTVFEVQAYASMLLGGALSFNFIFPSNDPDIWRLMGMWSIWMFTIPSLRARDCSKNEKEALNYLFLLVPLINVIIPFFWKSFAIVWSADVVAFLVMYAWKLGWLQKAENE